MTKLLTMICSLACCQLMAQPRLDATHLLLDGRLTKAEASSRPFVYNSLQDAVAHLSDTTTIYVMPWVYWVDNPDTPEVRVGEGGREPFGMVIRTKKLTLTGLCTDARDVVFASQRGQTQGAVGNFTMFDFHVDELTVQNMTMGNFCNVDLDYPRQPELNRPRRSSTITQAHVGYVHGRWLDARNVRFVSRLNLNPLNGAAESRYDSCHFECTDDALNGGRAVYTHCDFDLYGQKPWWSTFGTGPLLVDCDFHVMGDSREVYFCKQGGPLTVVDCRFHAPDSCSVGWTAYPQPWLRCYQRGFTLNGRPYTIGGEQQQNTVVLPPDRAVTAPLSLPINQREVRLTAPARLSLTTEEGAAWHVEPGFAHCATFSQEGDSTIIDLNNHSNEVLSFCITARTADHREAACHIVLAPAMLPAPRFAKQPTVRIENGRAWVDYELELNPGLRDESVVTWYRFAPDADSILATLAVSHGRPAKSYRLMPGDAGCRIAAVVQPKHQRSHAGAASTATTGVIAHSTPDSYWLDTDFSTFSCNWQESTLPDTWTVDGYKPADTSQYDWSFSRSKPMWEYGEGFNGAVGKGLLQAQRGARLMYTPAEGTYGSQELTLAVDPTKTAGQGFGSATGQYLDVCLKFDTHTLTGYGLRIIRTVKHAKAVDFLLVEYRNGTVTPLTEAVSATCYRTGCTISLSYANGLLQAHVTTTTPHPADSPLPHEVSLQARVKGNTFGGIHLQHTGSCGESTTMLHRLKSTFTVQNSKKRHKD